MNKKIVSTALITMLSSGLSIYASELNNTEVNQVNEISTNHTRSVSTSSGIISTENLNIRSGASKSYSVVTVVPENTVVQILKESNGWYQVSVNNKIGWANGKYITKVSTGVVNTINLNVRKGAGTSYSVLGTLPQGTQVIIHETKDGWAKIEYKNTYGWVNAKYLNLNGSSNSASTLSTTKGTIHTYDVNLRKTASYSAANICVIKKNSTVDVLSSDSTWTKVRYNGNEGYVMTKYVKVNTTSSSNSSSNTTTNNIISSGYTTADSLNVRKGPSTSYSILGKLSKNSKVDIYENKNGWSRIKYNNQDAWISSNYISKSSSSSSSSSTSTTKGTIHTYDVNLRKTASYSAANICVIKKNSTVDVLSSDSTWTKVRYNGNEGYVLSKYVKTNGVTNNNTSNNTTSYKTGTVTGNGLNVRSGASTSHSVIGTLNKGDKVTIISTDSNGWHKIKLSNGKEGYVSGKYVTTSDVSTDNSTNTGQPVSNKLIAIDFGHQLPINAGAVGIKKEDTVIKEVGDRLISKLKANGYNVINVTPTSATSISHSLNQRSQAANKAGADLFVSIHFNAASSSSANGAEVFYSTKSGSTSLASEILEEIVNLGYRNRGIKNGSNLSVLRNTNMTGVLVECAFLTNQSDMNRYNPDTMSNAIFNGIVDYLD